MVVVRAERMGAEPVPGYQERRKRIVRDALTLLLVGALYAGFVQVTGWGLPCPIRHFTGLQCPGCGMTRMCMALLHLDFQAAFHANAVVLCLLPLLAINAAQLIWLYIYKAQTRSAVTDAINWFSIAVLLLFCVVRNLV